MNCITGYIIYPKSYIIYHLQNPRKLFKLCQISSLFILCNNAATVHVTVTYVPWSFFALLIFLFMEEKVCDLFAIFSFYMLAYSVKFLIFTSMTLEGWIVIAILIKY